MTKMVQTSINGRWNLLLPQHRAERPEWIWWEAQRLSVMYHVINAMAQKVGTRSAQRGCPHSWDYQNPSNEPCLYCGITRDLARVHRDSRTYPLVVDVGTEEGDLSALYSLWGADVALFEPNDKVWPNIKAIWEANSLRDPVMCFAGFAADETDFASHEMTGWPPCANGPIIGDHGFKTLPEYPNIFRTRLDRISWGRRVDVITLDVEGAELRVLRGAEGLLREDKPVVFCSVHPGFMQDTYGDTKLKLFSYMAHLQYTSTFLCTDHEEHWVFQHPDNRWLP